MTKFILESPVSHKNAYELKDERRKID